MFSIQIEEKYRENNKKFHVSITSEVDPNVNVVQSKNTNLNRKKFKRVKSQI